MRPTNDRRTGGETGGKPAADRASFYDEVTAKMIAELDGDRIPWVQPWGKAGTAPPGLPRNAVTSRHYSGINVLILWGALSERGHPLQNWLMFKQARDAGGCVRKDEHGVTVVYADRFTPQAEILRARENGDQANGVSFLKRFTVFNVAQCKGLLPQFANEPEPLPEREIVHVAEDVIAASGVDFCIGGDKVYVSDPELR